MLFIWWLSIQVWPRLETMILSTSIPMAQISIPRENFAELKPNLKYFLSKKTINMPSQQSYCSKLIHAFIQQPLMSQSISFNSKLVHLTCIISWVNSSRFWDKGITLCFNFKKKLGHNNMLKYKKGSSKYLCFFCTWWSIHILKIHNIM